MSRSIVIFQVFIIYSSLEFVLFVVSKSYKGIKGQRRQFFSKFLPARLLQPGSVVGIATAYGLDGPGIESQWERDFPH